MKGRRLPCHQHRAGLLGSQTEPFMQKVCVVTTGKLSQEGRGANPHSRNRYHHAFNRRARDRIRTANGLFVGAALMATRAGP